MKQHWVKHVRFQKMKSHLNVTEALVKANDEINKCIDGLYESQFSNLNSTGSGVAVSGGDSTVSAAPDDPQIMPSPNDENFTIIEKSYFKEEPWIESQPDFVAGDVDLKGERYDDSR